MPGPSRDIGDADHDGDARGPVDNGLTAVACMPLNGSNDIKRQDWLWH